MLKESVRNLYGRWLDKATNINADNTERIFDRFITLFIPYNSLYNAIPAVIAANYKDYRNATTEVVTYLDATVLLNKITIDNNSEIEEFIHILENWRFNICLKRGEMYRPYDIALLRGFQSADDTIKTTAILTFIYKVRCNVIHGNKNIEEYQEQVVIPVTRVLETVLTMLFDKLNT